MKLIFIILFLNILQVILSEKDELIVELANGKLQGRNNDKYYSYESIPYAEPPLGELRFEAPQPYRRQWNETFDATRQQEECMQWDQFVNDENKLHGAEDCLKLNVYKPKTGKSKYPVIVFIHGGSFMFGSPNKAVPDNFMRSGEVIFVTLAYRLGPLGFLSTEDNVITGNYGLKDQRLALEWIKANIAKFGGDSDNILLLGFSAGAAASHMQMLREDFKGLAKAVISMSGVALNPWVIHTNSYEKSVKLAKYLNCSHWNATTAAIKKCLKTKTAQEIVSAVKEFHVFGYNPFSTFGPVVENAEASGAFITQHPRDIIKSGKYTNIPLLATYAVQEGGYNALELLTSSPTTNREYIYDMNDNWLTWLPIAFYLNDTYSDPVDYAKQLKLKYMGEEKLSTENYLKVQNMYSDILFINGIEESLRLHARNSHSPVYGYAYDNPAALETRSFFTDREDIEFGTIHGDDVALIFNWFSSLRTDQEKHSESLTKMLTDYASLGKLQFDNCTFEGNTDYDGNVGHLQMILITRDKCQRVIR